MAASERTRKRPCPACGEVYGTRRLRCPSCGEANKALPEPSGEPKAWQVLSLCAIGIGFGLLIAGLVIMPVFITGPLAEMATGRRPPWLAVVNWPLVISGVVLVVVGFGMRGRNLSR